MALWLSPERRRKVLNNATYAQELRLSPKSSLKCIEQRTPGVQLRCFRTFFKNGSIKLSKMFIACSNIIMMMLIYTLLDTLLVLIRAILQNKAKNVIWKVTKIDFTKLWINFVIEFCIIFPKSETIADLIKILELKWTFWSTFFTKTAFYLFSDYPNPSLPYWEAVERELCLTFV